MLVPVGATDPELATVEYGHEHGCIGVAVLHYGQWLCVLRRILCSRHVDSHGGDRILHARVCPANVPTGPELALQNRAAPIAAQRP